MDTPFVHQGRVKGLAVDCIGLIGCVGIEAGSQEAVEWARDPAMNGYAKQPDPKVLMAGCRKYLDEISRVDAGLGDIFVMRFEKEPHHFAFVSNLSPARVIHAYSAAGKVCEQGIDGEWRTGKTWRSLIVSAWRFRGLS